MSNFDFKKLREQSRATGELLKDTFKATDSQLIGIAKRSDNPDWQKSHVEGMRKTAQTEEWKKAHQARIDKLSNDPEHIKKMTEVNRKTAQTEEWKKAYSKGMELREVNGWNEKNANKNKEVAKTEKWKQAHSAAARRYSESGKALENNRKIIEQRQQDPEYFIKLKEGIAKRTQDPEWQRKNAEAQRKRAKCISTPDGAFLLKEAINFFSSKRNITHSSAETWLLAQRKKYPKDFYLITQEEYTKLTGKEI